MLMKSFINWPCSHSALCLLLVSIPSADRENRARKDGHHMLSRVGDSYVCEVGELAQIYAGHAPSSDDGFCCAIAEINGS